MLLKINDHLHVSDLQENFSESFPALHIEFFKGHHEKKMNQPAGGMTSVGDLSNKHLNGELEIKSWQKAGAVAAAFRDQFGLLVQLYRMEKEKIIPLDDHERPADFLPEVIRENPPPAAGGIAEDVRLSI